MRENESFLGYCVTKVLHTKNHRKSSFFMFCESEVNEAAEVTEESPIPRVSDPALRSG